MNQVVFFEGKYYNIPFSFYKKIFLEETSQILSEYYMYSIKKLSQDKLLNEAKIKFLQEGFLDSIKKFGGKIVKKIGSIWQKIKRKFKLGKLETKYEDVIDEKFSSKLIEKYLIYLYKKFPKGQINKRLITVLIDEQGFEEKDAEEYARAIAIAAEKAKKDGQIPQGVNVYDPMTFNIETGSEKDQTNVATPMGSSVTTGGGGVVREVPPGDVDALLGRNIDILRNRTGTRTTSVGDTARSGARDAEMPSRMAKATSSADDSETEMDNYEEASAFHFDLYKRLKNLRVSRKDQKAFNKLQDDISKAIEKRTNKDTDPRSVLVLEEEDKKIVKITLSKLIQKANIEPELKQDVYDTVTSWLADNDMNTSMFKALYSKRSGTAQLTVDTAYLREMFKKAERIAKIASGIEKPEEAAAAEELANATEEIATAVSSEIDPKTGLIKPEALKSLQNKLEQTKNIVNNINKKVTKKDLLDIVKSFISSTEEDLQKAFAAIKKPDSRTSSSEEPAPLQEFLFSKNGDLLILKR